MKQRYSGNWLADWMDEQDERDEDEVEEPEPGYRQEEEEE
jgi:hypothetical protein